MDLPAGEYCCLSVSDTGTGIAPDVMDNLFEPYFTTKEVGKGTGLGLSVVHGIVKNCQGGIAVNSEPGKGTVFYIYLPLIAVTIEIDERPTTDRNIIGGHESILFVDDEISIVKLSTRILEKFGYKVTGTTSSINALTLFESKPDEFDLVVTDMSMPDMIGTQLAKKIIEIHPDIPIIICTGFSERLDNETAMQIGIKDYLHKPMTIDELSLKVREVLDRAKNG